MKQFVPEAEISINQSMFVLCEGCLCSQQTIAAFHTNKCSALQVCNFHAASGLCLGAVDAFLRPLGPVDLVFIEVLRSSAAWEDFDGRLPEWKPTLASTWLFLNVNTE